MTRDRAALLAEADRALAAQDFGGAATLLEAAAAILVVYAVGRKHLDGYIPVEAWIASAIDLPHPPSPDESKYLVRPERRTRL